MSSFIIKNIKLEFDVHHSWKETAKSERNLRPFTYSTKQDPLQACLKIMAWVAIPFSRWPSRPRDRALVSCLEGRFFTTEPPRSPDEQLLVLKWEHLAPPRVTQFILSPLSSWSDHLCLLTGFIHMKTKLFIRLWQEIVLYLGQGFCWS